MIQEPHNVEWTPEKIANFWKVNHSLFARRRYSQQVGPALARLIGRDVAKPGSRILDFGCGDGALLTRMINGRSVLVGYDFEPPAASLPWPKDPEQSKVLSLSNFYYISNERLGEISGVFDAVLLVEVVEHLPDRDLDQMLSTSLQALRPGGRLFITTPNEESLHQNTVNCPDCNCIFHRVQHVRSWDIETLTRYVAERGFAPKKVFATDLGRMQRSFASRWVHTVVDVLDKRKLPHLIGIFVKQ